MSEPLCPVCGTEMRKWNHPRGSHGGRVHSCGPASQRWICPKGESEVVNDERGRRCKVAPNAVHSIPERLWSAREIEAAKGAHA
jgi:hypothetical protein